MQTDGVTSTFQMSTRAPLLLVVRPVYLGMKSQAGIWSQSQQLTLCFKPIPTLIALMKHLEVDVPRYSRTYRSVIWFAVFDPTSNGPTSRSLTRLVYLLEEQHLGPYYVSTTSFNR